MKPMTCPQTYGNTGNTRERLENELEKLRHEFNVSLPAQIAEAREHGDLKENAGYHAARERMGFVKGKIAQLSRQLAMLDNIDLSNISEDSIGFGSRIILEGIDSNDPVEITFVSEAEIDFDKGRITLTTPYGRALAGKKVGDEVEVTIPAGVRKLKVKYLLTIHGNEYGKEE